MKYILVLLLGLVTGAALFAIGLVYNPLFSEATLSPLAMTESQTITLGYPAVASEGIAYTNDGESRTRPYPEKILQLWEAPIRQTSAMVALLWDGRNRAAGLGVKIASASEATRLLDGKAMVDSVWYVYLPGRGSLFIEETENYWNFLRDVVVPAYRSSADTWRGTWLSNITAGPGALGTAKVTGGSGEFSGMEMLGVESLSVRVWRVDRGTVAGEGQLLIELPSGSSTESGSEAKGDAQL